MMSHERAQRDARTLVARGLPDKRHRALREHLRGCDDCARDYESLRAVEDQLAPSGDIMAPAAFERLGALVLDEVAPAPKRVGLSWLYGLSAATAMAVVMLLVVPRQRTDEFSSRGITAVPTHGVSLFVIDPATRNVSRAEVRNHHVTVPADRLVQLAYRTTDERYLTVIGIDASGSAQVYYPGDADRDATLLANASDEPLPGAWDLSEVATPLRLYAFFGTTPVDREAALAEAKSGRPQPTLLIDVATR